MPPIEFGAEAVGGAINLVTRRGGLVPELRVSVGAGSFGARSASAGWSGIDHGLRIDISAAYNGAAGDFTYYDTAGTLFNQTDDRISTRHNNDFNQGAVDATVSGRHWRPARTATSRIRARPASGSPAPSRCTRDCSRRARSSTATSTATSARGAGGWRRRSCTSGSASPTRPATSRGRSAPRSRKRRRSPKGSTARLRALGKHSAGSCSPIFAARSAGRPTSSISRSRAARPSASSAASASRTSCASSTSGSR